MLFEDRNVVLCNSVSLRLGILLVIIISQYIFNNTVE